MSPLTQGLTLHLRLSDPAGTTLGDDSGLGNHGTAVGGVRLVYDSTFGVCREFDGTGSHVAVPSDPFPDPSVFTIALWVQEPPGTPRTMVYRGLVGKQGDAQRKPGLWWYGGGLHYDSYDPAGARFGDVIPGFFQELGRWVHVAWVKDGATYRFYRNGVPVHTAPAPATVYTAPTPYWVGRVDNFWNGRLAAVRVYRRALPEAEVWEAMEADRVVPFRDSHPVGFELHGESHEHALYIEDNPAAPAREARLRIRNTAGRPLYLLQPAAGTAVGPDNHHFRLRFRRGVLSTGTLRGLKLVDSVWQASLPQEETDGVSVYLLRSSRATLAPGEAVELVLRPLHASPAGGPRSTRVELATGLVAYEQAVMPGGTITETRSQVLNVVGYSGRRDAPFHVGLVGSGQVLNVGRPAPGNDLTLRITNTLAPNPAFPERSRLVLTGPETGTATRIVVSVDQEPDAAPGSMPWALARAGELNAVAVDPPPGWTRADAVVGNAREWTFTPPATQVLNAGEFREIRLRGIVSSLQAGTATLRVRWMGVPGHWDGHEGVPVAKSPLHFLRAGNVGVGTAEPVGFLVQLPEQGGVGGSPPGVMLSGGVQGNASIELRNNGGGTPYLDFSQRPGPDYDARLILIAPGKLLVDRAALGIGTDPQTPLHVGGRATVTTGANHLLLHRQANQPPGNVVFLELFQEPTGNPVHPSIRFHKHSQFWHRLEGRPEGLFIKDGHEGNDELRDLYARTAVLNGVRISSGAFHVQLQRPASQPPGTVVFLELLQEATGNAVFPSIRFHKSNQFWHRIEARPEGLFIKDGHEPSNELRDLYARTVTMSALRIGNTAIGEAELAWLKRAAGGGLVATY